MNPTQEIVLLSTFAVIITAGLLGNCLVCFVLLRNKSLRHNKPVNTVLLNLAVADTTVLLFLAPRHVFFGAFTHPVGPAGDYLCKFITGGNVAWIGAVTSVLSLVFIALERYYAVVKPHEYNKTFNPKLVETVIVFSWLFAFCFCVPLFFVVRYDAKISFCVEDWWNVTISRCYSVLWFLTAGIFPVIIMVYFYSKVVFVLWIKNRDATSTTGQLATRLARQKARKRICKILFIISFVYCASWFPPLTNYILVYFQPNNSFSNVAYLGSVVMVTFNSAINPAIYACYSGGFRQHLREIWKQKAGGTSYFHSSAGGRETNGASIVRKEHRKITSHVNMSYPSNTTDPSPRQQESGL